MPLSPREDTNRRMLRARDEMDRRYAEALDVPSLAGLAQLSPSQLGRVFKEVFGETPHRYLRRRRVERAMTLLRQTDRPVTEVACDVDDDSAAQVRELVTKGALGGLFLTSSDVHATFEALRDAGVEITQEPVEQPYGVDFGIRDSFGNHLRISQPNQAPNGRRSSDATTLHRGDRWRHRARGGPQPSLSRTSATPGCASRRSSGSSPG